MRHHNRTDPDFLTAAKTMREAGIPIRQNATEFYNLWNLVKLRQQSNFLEIGALHGWSVYMLAQALKPPTKIMTIDLSPTITNSWHEGMYLTLDTRHVDPFEAFAARLPELSRVESMLIAQGHDVKIVDANSHDSTVLPLVSEFFGGDNVDLLFIDGDDGYLGVRLDWNMYARFVRGNGYIALHDIRTRILGHGEKRRKFGVRHLWSQIEQRFKTNLYMQAQHKRGIGVAHIPPSSDPRWWVI